MSPAEAVDDPSASIPQKDLTQSHFTFVASTNVRS
jgi:hypothetical protein